MNVFRFRRFWEHAPTPQQQLLRDARLKTVNSLRSFLNIESEYPGADSVTADTVRTLLKNYQRNRKPTAAFLSFLQDLLVAGELESVPEQAANYVDNAKHGLQGRTYDKRFDNDTLLRYHAHSIARSARSSFTEITGIAPVQIKSLSQLTDALCGAGFTYEVDDRMYFLYLDGLDDTTPESVFRSVVTEIANSNPVFSIRKKAAHILEGFGWIKKNGVWVRGTE